jgi:hypothetical protein
VVLGLRADLPQPASGSSHRCDDGLDELEDEVPAVDGHGLADLLGEVAELHRGAVDVELQLVGGAVADAHRSGAPVALEVVELELDEVLLAGDAVQRPQRVGAADVVGQLRRATG